MTFGWCNFSYQLQVKFGCRNYLCYHWVTKLINETYWPSSLISYNDQWLCAALIHVSYNNQSWFVLFWCFLRETVLIIKLFHLKAKMTHDFRWEQPNEAEARPFQNITTDFDHSLAYQNNEAFYMVLQSSILANLVTYFKVQIWQT